MNFFPFLKFKTTQMKEYKNTVEKDNIFYPFSPLFKPLNKTLNRRPSPHSYTVLLKVVDFREVSVKCTIGHHRHLLCSSEYDHFFPLLIASAIFWKIPEKKNTCIRIRNSLDPQLIINSLNIMPI